MKKLLIAGLLLIPALAFAKATLQNEDFKSKAQLEAAGGTQAQLLNDTKIYVTGNGLNRQLSQAITDGVIGGSGGTFKNFLTNAAFDQGSSTTGWTASAGTFAATNDSDKKYAGNYSGSWTPAAASNTLINTAFTITSGGGPAGNGAVSCMVKTSSVLHKMQVLDGANVLNEVTITGASTYAPVILNFVFPASSTGINLRFLAGDTGNILVDECFLGDARVVNMTNVSQAQLLGTLTVTGCASVWSTTSTSFASFAAQTGCVYTATGSAQAPATNIPAIKFASLQAGEYRIEYEGEWGNSTSSKTAQLQFTDGTNTAREASSVYSTTTIVAIPSVSQTLSLATSQSNVTFELKGKTDSGGTTFVEGQNSPFQGVFRVYYFPPASSVAVTPDLQPALSGVKFAGAGGRVYDGTSGTAQLVTISSLDGDKAYFGKGQAHATANAVGFKVPSLPAGRYRITSQMFFEAEYGGSGYTDCWYYVSDDGGSTLYPLAEKFVDPNSVTGDENHTSAMITYSSVQTDKTFGLYVKRTGTGGHCYVQMQQGPMNFYIEPMDQQVPQPVIMNQVSTTQAAGTKINSARIGGATVDTKCDGTCTVYNETGDWISTATRNGTGDYTIAFNSGIFATAPSCFAQIGAGPSGYPSCKVSTTTTSSVQVYCGLNSTDGDASFGLFCNANK